ncbi:fatty acid desaturase [Sulfurimonas gotlandica GD1]|uniref:Fatty acid desaturase n=1 Tax=Sulfurimonas gotlandica (strain DSM 19862 / JCM 16533 / GD1) TaxID=929558 RepID=B6BI01_SULGG|nr:fatty acid desaturase [Sulfurimonas gotlandica]EDZ63119.1 fatty acid desaturase family protein [Sulfurimonas gotlandica GD1]EHP30153.1 fatty acid desaturase [Sulfurimonas gotlandica GD1]
MSARENKVFEDILNARESIISTEEAEELSAQEKILKHEAEIAIQELSTSSEPIIKHLKEEKISSTHVYAKYEDVDKEELQRDLEEIKANLGPVGEEDYQHLLKLERWGRGATLSGFFLIYMATALEISIGLSTFGFWTLGIVAAILVGVGNVARWANVAHPILHGAYDKVPNIPKQYTKSGFARGKRRYIDWLDWIKPEAWEYEHNIMHHYHLGEDDDPDNVERNLQWLIQSKVPMWLRRVIVYMFAAVWKPVYYAPNTLRILENKERRKKRLPEITEYQISPFTENGKELWKNFYLPYALVKFALLPLLFLPLGTSAVFSALIIMLMAEVYANLHSFLVIVPNHSAGDIYQFSEPHKSQGEFYLRQIMGSVNYSTGSDLIDFSQGFLNYQIEHHLFPNTPQSYQQKMQPLVKEVCRKHNIEYRQESVFKRIGMTIDLMVGKSKLLRVDGI